jgi:hypothetical protein
MTADQLKTLNLLLALTQDQRGQLNTIALRTAIFWATIIALGWFLIWWLVPNDESASGGVILWLGVCIFAFVRKRKSMLNRAEMIRSDLIRRHGLDTLDAEEQTKSGNQN